MNKYLASKRYLILAGVTLLFSFSLMFVVFYETFFHRDLLHAQELQSDAEEIATAVEEFYRSHERYPNSWGEITTESKEAFDIIRINGSELGDQECIDKTDGMGGPCNSLILNYTDGVIHDIGYNAGYSLMCTIDTNTEKWSCINP